MKDPGARAAVAFSCGNCNCAQSVLLACEDYTGLDDCLACKAAAGLGGGVRCGEICGAITGAALAFGLALGGTNMPNGKRGGVVANLTQQLVGDFSEQFGAIRCADLLGDGGKHGTCRDFVTFAATQAAALIEKETSKGDK